MTLALWAILALLGTFTALVGLLCWLGNYDEETTHRD